MGEPVGISRKNHPSVTGDDGIICRPRIFIKRAAFFFLLARPSVSCQMAPLLGRGPRDAPPRRNCSALSLNKSFGCRSLRYLSESGSGLITVVAFSRQTVVPGKFPKKCDTNRREGVGSSGPTGLCFPGRQKKFFRAPGDGLHIRSSNLTAAHSSV